MDGQQAFELLRDWAPLFIALLAPNVIQSLSYLRIRRMWSALPVVIGTITRSKLLDYHDEDGKRVYEADVRVRYVFRGQEYESHTPALRSYRLFPQWHFWPYLKQGSS